jgi:hypothetical protein
MLDLLVTATEEVERAQNRGKDKARQRGPGREQLTRREPRNPPMGDLQKPRGWLKLTADGDGFEAIEVRRSPTHGGSGGLGVFVKEGFALLTGAQIPYFGRWIPHDEVDDEQSAYLVGPYSGNMYVDGNPAKLATERHSADSELWAGARVNQANTPQERNCMIRAVGEGSRFLLKKDYERESQQPLRCSIEVTRPIREGMELLANYGWLLHVQQANKCGYNFHAERNNLPHEEGELIEDEDIIASSSRKR